MEEQRKGVEDVADAATSLLVSNDVNVAGLEEDLVRTGGYIGQRELAQLIEDWARVDDAPAPRYSANSKSITLRGNARMAARVTELAKSHRRTSAETQEIAAALRDEMPVTFMLDQELARENGGRLLTATSPLVMAALSVPGYYQARFASLAVPANASQAITGTFMVLLAKVVSGSAAGDEIWGEAIGMNGERVGAAPVDELLSALASGQLADFPLPDLPNVASMVDRTLDQLHLRFEKEQIRRTEEFNAHKATREITLREQYDRAIATRRKRLATAIERRRGEKTIRLFEGQIRRAEFKHEIALRNNAEQQPPSLRFEPLVACILTVGKANDER